MAIDLKNYQCNHLFLIIGKNPLPNYVATKLLIPASSNKSNTFIYAIHSKDNPNQQSGTEEYAKNLKYVLEKMLGKDRFTWNFVEVTDESDPEAIQQAVNKHIKNITDSQNNNSSTIGLHYTGGTKVMAVHSYLKIATQVTKYNQDNKNTKIKLFFSYLNPRKIDLRFDFLSDGGKATFSIDPNNNLFTETEISLEHLLALHGLKFLAGKTTPRKNVYHDNLLDPLLRISLLDKNNPEYKEWIGKEENGVWRPGFKQKLQTLLNDCEKRAKKNLGSRYSKKNLIAEKNKHLKTESIPLFNIAGNNLNDLSTELHNCKLAHNNNIDFNNLALENNETTVEFAEFLVSKWFEDYTLKQVLDIANKCNLHDCGVNFETDRPDKPHEPYFEIDVIAIKGYQLFALSCSLDSEVSRCKQKLFEIYIRAKQLGGDEARIGLVCLVDNPSHVEQQLQQDWNEDPGKIKVFGKTQLPSLKNHLEQWFNQK